ncbi:MULTISPECIES: ribonuclease E/G [Actibacterium]|uniref:Ribonuclease G/E n=1 Tax=Actibacterium naphthalenivorans TaxID=1614693 RepID=A0A840CAT0_9RHOB|nr:MULTISPECIES: ribonuclease E/G [Actibacterium]ALG91154.1 ribonuclease G [Actibacterium sp. EMB200-NS6]MBB4022505.1 Ribonuclease G/E [Actibacterium naphthalenivorans]
MKGRTVILGQLNGRAAAALMVNGRLEDLLVDPPEDLPAPGAIFRATVDRQVKGQGGIFLKLPGGTAFMRQAKGLAPGQTLLVQVSGFAEPGKAVPVTPKPLFKSRYAIVTPGAPGLNVSRTIRDDEERDRLLEIAHAAMGEESSGFGLILRSAAAGVAEEEIAADISAMRDVAQAVMSEGVGAPELLLDAPDAHMRAWRDWADPDPDEVIEGDSALADLGVLDAIDALAGPASLPGGGALYIEPTRALLAVDVNTGPDTSPAAGLKANLAAARDLPRQLRLRGLSGQIIVDFAPMPQKDRRQLEQVLKAAFRPDPVDTTFAGWTPLGNFEILRKRERLPLTEGREK